MANVTFHPLNEVDDELIKYAVVVARYGEKWIFCRHRDRATWEIPGGHREPGETPLETARRELYEETGAVEADIHVVGAYHLTDYGLLCFAEVNKLENIPDSSEIQEIQLCDVIPGELTYGAVHAQLFEWVQGWLNMQTNAGELWDVYDENRKPTGRTHRRGDFLARGDYHLVVHIWIQNQKGEYLITKRSPNKGFPNMWECTGGSALAGDDSLSAALREVREETGLELRPENGRRVITRRASDHFSDIWLFRQDFDLRDVKLLEGETCDVMYADRDCILSLLTSGKFVPFVWLDALLDIGSVHDILGRMGYPQPESVTRFHNAEDGEAYNVWRVDYPERTLVLKAAKGEEAEIYRKWFTEPVGYAPRLYEAQDGYLLMEYVPGNDLRRACREDLRLAVKSLIAMGQVHWGEHAEIPPSRRNRREYLCDPRLERASLARLSAHGEADENAFFYLKDTDRSVVINHFYYDFVGRKGISRDDFNLHLALCLLHEYCEWVYVGNKYGDTQSERFQKYREKALILAGMINRWFS